MDGHAATFPRAQIPDVQAASDGSFTDPPPLGPQKMSARFSYPKWRLDQ
jgi:hypothetical protein